MPPLFVGDKVRCDTAGQLEGHHRLRFEHLFRKFSVRRRSSCNGPAAVRLPCESDAAQRDAAVAVGPQICSSLVQHYGLEHRWGQDVDKTAVMRQVRFGGPRNGPVCNGRSLKRLDEARRQRRFHSRAVLCAFWTRVKLLYPVGVVWLRGQVHDRWRRPKPSATPQHPGQRLVHDTLELGVKLDRRRLTGPHVVRHVFVGIFFRVVEVVLLKRAQFICLGGVEVWCWQRHRLGGWSVELPAELDAALAVVESTTAVVVPATPKVCRAVGSSGVKIVCSGFAVVKVGLLGLVIGCVVPLQGRFTLGSAADLVDPLLGFCIAAGAELVHACLPL
mmetsp:Transcript_20251/g.60469  ORF Transcript_20251/g.60469 Transcript_20251/m.60469 type:complete len:332 (-) Transcript_20251:854-1849(-)